MEPKAEIVTVTSTALTTQSAAQAAHVRELDEATAHALKTNVLRPATRKAYAYGWGRFTDFCTRRGVPALPASSDRVASFLLACASGLPADPKLDLPEDPDEGIAPMSLRTIVVFRAAISHYHEEAGVPVPTRDDTIKKAMKVIRNAIGSKEPKKREMLGYALLQRVLLGIPAKGLHNLRDRAILSVLGSSGMRRSEAMKLTVDDLTYERDVMIATLRNTKTALIHRVPLHAHLDPNTCPVRNLGAWRSAAGHTTGRVFRGIHKSGSLLPTLGGQYVARMIRSRLRDAGVPLDIAARFGGHSTRRGFITDAALAGVPLPVIQKYTGQTIEQIVDYVDRSNLTAEDAISKRFQGKDKGERT